MWVPLARDKIIIKVAPPFYPPFLHSQLLTGWTLSFIPLSWITQLTQSPLCCCLVNSGWACFPNWHPWYVYSHHTCIFIPITTTLDQFHLPSWPVEYIGIWNLVFSIDSGPRTADDMLMWGKLPDTEFLWRDFSLSPKQSRELKKSVQSRLRNWRVDFLDDLQIASLGSSALLGIIYFILSPNRGVMALRTLSAIN